jgi:hypothetical protein
MKSRLTRRGLGRPPSCTVQLQPCVAWLVGLFVPYPVVVAINGQVAARITPMIVDLGLWRLQGVAVRGGKGRARFTCLDD